MLRPAPRVRSILIVATCSAKFATAGVVQSDEVILRVMNELMLQAANQMGETRGDAPDAAAMMLARNLMSQ
jgi:hypothetical protein